MPDQYGTFGSYLSDTLASNREFSKDYGATQALRALSRNPNDSTAQAAVLATSPNLYPGILNAQTAQRRQAADEAQTAAANMARANVFRRSQGLPPLAVASSVPQGGGGMAPAGATYPTSIAAPNPVAPSASPVGSGPGAPAQPSSGNLPPAEPGDVTVVAPQRKMSAQDQAMAVFAEDPTGEVFKQFTAFQDHVSKLDEAGRKQLADRTEAFGSIIPSLQGMPYAQRRDVIDANRAYFKSHDWTDAEIDGYDPTDQNLSASLGQALGAKGVLERGDKDRNFAETQREHTLSHADAAASRAVTVRGQNMTDRRSREANAAAAAPDPVMLNYMADKLRSDPDHPPQFGFGRQGAALRAAVYTLAAQKDQAEGKGGGDLVGAAAAATGRRAGARTIGSTTAKVDYAVNELTASIPLARAASSEVPRDQFVPFNRVQQILQRGGGSAQLRKFAVMTQSALNAYNLTTARAGTTQAEREHNATLLSTADSPEAYNAALSAMAREGAVAKAASHKTMGEFTTTSSRQSHPADVQAILKKYGH